MKVSPAKENILKRVRHALSQPVQLPFPNSEGNTSVFQTSADSLDIQFAEEFTRLEGKFVFCQDIGELRVNLGALLEAKHWKQVVCLEEELSGALEGIPLSWLSKLPVEEDFDAGISRCEFLIARTGSILISSSFRSGRGLPVFAPVHIVVASVEQLVPDIRDGLARMREKYPQRLPSMVSLQTGPSRTADIEKTLVVGVHGPREVYVFLLDEPLDPRHSAGRPEPS